LQAASRLETRSLDDQNFPQMLFQTIATLRTAAGREILSTSAGRVLP
jgi:hypothetical protein